MKAYGGRPELLWRPAHEGRFSRVEVFRRFVNRKHGLALKDYYDLHQYSVQHWEFWKDSWDFLGILYSVPPTEVIIDRPQQDVPEFFPGARLNYAENQLKRDDDSIAVTAMRETGDIKEYTHKELRALVRDMGNAMRAHGVKPGDRIVAVITNSIHAVVVALAAASVGAMFSSTAPDMGVQSILDRYRQVTPKLLFVDTEVFYAGEQIDLAPRVAEITKDLTFHYGLEKTILIPSTITGRCTSMDIPQSVTLDEFLAPGMGGELIFEQLPFNHPFWILYSSGTSGSPKCIVHSAGGALLQTLKECSFALDMNQHDCFFQYSTTGWILFASLVGSLAVGSRVVLYDGSPFHPDVREFLNFVSSQGVSVLGLGPRFFTEIQGMEIKPLQSTAEELTNFDALRIIFVTGAVLTPRMFRWIYSAFPQHIHLVSGSGGTDICSGFVSGVPTLPVYAGEIQGKCLGMKVEVWDPVGRNIEHTGTPGELVCTRAHPTLPLFLWNDAGGKLYKATYFSVYPGVWMQGDFMVVNPVTKGIKILGRSDGVLNPGGVRFGAAEVYGVLEQFGHEIEDALCVGQRRSCDMDERVLLFLKMRGTRRLDYAFENEVRGAIRTALSRRHEPSYIFEVEDIPYTVNGKKVEIAVKQIVSGTKIKPSGTVANPAALMQYYKYVELEKLVGDTTRKPRVKL